MSLPTETCSNTTTDTAETVELLAARSSVYAVLAHGFFHPDQSTIAFFDRCRQAEIKTRDKISEIMLDILKASQSVTLEELAAAYMRLFHLLNGPFPYQAEFDRNHEFSKVHNLADIMGFYRAFGVEPQKERPDHIAVQLEFMHLLILKEKHALETGQLEKASLCKDAGAKFLCRHLSTWTDHLLQALQARCDDTIPFYIHQMALLESYMQMEKETLL